MNTSVCKHQHTIAGLLGYRAKACHASGTGMSMILMLAVAVGVSEGTTRAADMKDATQQRVKKAAVMVFTSASKREKGDTPLSSGSGFFINSTGLMITNNHVVDPVHMKSEEEKQAFHYQTGRLTWTVITDSGTEEEETWDAMVLYQNETADQAVLQVYDEDGDSLQWPHFLQIQPESRLSERTNVGALGCPGGDRQRTTRDRHPEVSLTTGSVLDIPHTPGGRVRMVYTDVIARPGNSGGPMVDGDGFLVGTVTLMTKPEGRENTGGSNYSALVPAKLTGEMVSYAFRLEKIPAGTDVTPFMEQLRQDDGRVNIPEYERLGDHDVLYFEDGDKIYGDVATNIIQWHSSLGSMAVPTSAIAYVMNNDENSHLFLEGGSHISASNMKGTFKFTPLGGTASEHRFDKVSVLGFRTSGSGLSPVDGKVTIIDTDAGHLVLSDVKGSVRFKSRIGSVSLALGDIFHVERRDNGKQVVTLHDGRRMTGRFSEDTYHGVIAATQTPIEFSFHRVDRVNIDIKHQRANHSGGLDLSGVVASAGGQVVRMARFLARGDVGSARSTLDKRLESASFKRATDNTKEKLRLIDAICLLRKGKYEDAHKAFRKMSRSKDINVAAYASAHAEVLKQYGNFQYRGRPLSEENAFVDAGIEVADRLVAEVRGLLADARGLKGKTRGEYTKALSNVRRHEPAMRVASVFMGTVAEDEMLRLWKYALHACEREIQRLSREREEIRSNRRLSATRELGIIAERLADAEEKGQALFSKLREYGFRIEDPDIQILREKK